jgi:DNA helicase-2/ATP-dependent DNA helicase PcrA
MGDSVKIPSFEQKAFYTWILTGTGSCVLEAVAGAGKTTTLIEALKLIQGDVYFGAYNKKIAQEIQDRAQKRDGIFIGTMHSAGFKAWRRVASRVKTDGNKCRDILRASYEANPTYAIYEQAVLSLVSYAKQAAVGITCDLKDWSKWQELVAYFDIDTLDQTNLVIKLAVKVLERSIEADHVVIDFDDMIYSPLVHKVRFFQHDWVFIDEAQDTNAARRQLALAMLKPNGRLVAVGDRHQAIYGFTGADSDALDLIAKATNAIRLPLTTTYRCPKNVVAHAQQFVKHIQAHESAPEGIVSHIALDQLVTAAVPGDAILSRTTAPLIKAVYRFITAGVAAKVEGREIGNGLKKLASRWKVKTYTAMTDKLAIYKEREIAKALAKDQESKVQAIEDMVECLLVLIARCEKLLPIPPNDAVTAVCGEIDKIFGESLGAEVVILSTIHKSKGREWAKVFWFQTGASPYAKLDWERQQEINLMYVATTRAKEELVLVSGDFK